MLVIWNKYGIPISKTMVIQLNYGHFCKYDITLYRIIRFLLHKSLYVLSGLIWTLHNKTQNVSGPCNLGTRLAKRRFLASFLDVSIRNSVTLSTSVWDRIKALKRLWIYFFSFGRFKYYNHIVLLWDFGCLQRRVEVSFCSILFLLGREGHHKLKIALKGALGSVQKSQSLKHRLSGKVYHAQLLGEMLFAELALIWFHMSALRKMKTICALLPTKCYLLVSPIFWIFSRFTDALELHTQTDSPHTPLPHLNCNIPLDAVQTHCMVCAFQNRQSHHKFP